MANIQETKISLRFSGDDLAQELTDRLGALPTSSAVKGEILVSPSSRVAKTGMWQLRVEAAAVGEEFSVQVTRLLEQLTSDHDTWRDLSGRFGGNLFVGLFLGSSNEGVVIESDTVNAIAARGLELGFDIYAPSEE